MGSHSRLIAPPFYWCSENLDICHANTSSVSPYKNCLLKGYISLNKSTWPGWTISTADRTYKVHNKENINGSFRDARGKTPNTKKSTEKFVWILASYIIVFKSAQHPKFTVGSSTWCYTFKHFRYFLKGHSFAIPWICHRPKSGWSIIIQTTPWFQMRSILSLKLTTQRQKHHIRSVYQGGLPETASEEHNVYCGRREFVENEL